MASGPKRDPITRDLPRRTPRLAQPVDHRTWESGAEHIGFKFQKLPVEAQPIWIGQEPTRRPTIDSLKLSLVIPEDPTGNSDEAHAIWSAYLLGSRGKSR